MYRAKANGKARSVVYEQALDDALGRRLSLLGELRRARIDSEFVLHYQPVVDLDTGGFWAPRRCCAGSTPRGIVPPGEFVPIAECGRSCLSVVGFCRPRAVGSRSGAPPGAPRDRHVSVNVSARQLQAAGFVADVEQALAERGPRAAGARARDHGSSRPRPTRRRADVGRAPRDGCRPRARRLRNGLLVARDARRPAVRRAEARPRLGMRIGASGGAVPLVRAIVDLGRALGLSLVAEGIENEDQLAELRRLASARARVPVRPPRACRDFEDLLRDGLGPATVGPRAFPGAAPAGAGDRAAAEPGRGRSARARVRDVA